MKQNEVMQRLDNATYALLAVVVVVPFLLSFGALRDLAAKNGVIMPWLYPVLIDGSLLIFKILAVRSSLRGKRNWYAWLMAFVFTAVSVVLNYAHVPVDVANPYLARGMAVLLPICMFTAVVAVANRIEEMVEDERESGEVLSIKEQIKALQLDRKEAEAATASATQELGDVQQKLDKAHDAWQQKRQEIARLHNAEMQELEQERQQLVQHIDELRASSRASQLNDTQAIIYALLQRNAQLSNADIARVLDVNASTVSRNRAKVEEAYNG